jgi:hypothetical protein
MPHKSTFVRTAEADGNSRGVVMATISRREFVATAVTSAAAAGFLATLPFELCANPLGMPIGCQTWPVRKMIAQDFPGTIKQLANAGFQTVELCSPVGYEEFGFGGLAKYSGAELRKILNDSGVPCISSHFGIEELRPGGPHCLGEGCRTYTDACAKPQRPEESDDGRRETGGG